MCLCALLKLINETDGGTDWTCEAFLPSSTFQIRDLVAVEEVAVEVHHQLDLELGKVLDLRLTNPSNWLEPVTDWRAIDMGYSI